MKKKITAEWKKEETEKALIKSWLRDTFSNRTEMLKEGVTFETFLKEYPCFEDANYVRIIVIFENFINA